MPGEGRNDREREVLADALREEQALATAILRHQRDAVAAGEALLRPVTGERLPPELDRAARPADAEERLEQFALAMALQAADAEHLALAETEVDVTKPLPRGEPAHAQSDALAGGRQRARR